MIEEAKDRPCTDCGCRFPTCVMDLGHVRGRKEFKVSEAVQRATAAAVERVRDEIAKCDVVCANCHRIRTQAAGYVAARRSARFAGPETVVAGFGGAAAINRDADTLRA
jgi:hypothetical protein